MKSVARTIGIAIFLALASEAAARQMLGQSKVACLSCHRIHSNSGNRHRPVLRNERCLTCHENRGKLARPKAAELHSETCEY